MQVLVKEIGKVTSSRATVMISGESGTGEAYRPRHPQLLLRRAQALHRHQLLGHRGHAAGERAVRPREGLLHRRHGPQARQVRAGRGRHRVPGRDRRHVADAPGEAAARAAGARVRARGRRAPHPAARASSPRATATSPRRCRAGASARTSTSASRSSPWRFPCCASGARTSPCWCTTCSSASTRRCTSASPACPRGARPPHPPALARQRARAGERAHPRRGARPGEGCRRPPARAGAQPRARAAGGQRRPPPPPSSPPRPWTTPASSPPWTRPSACSSSAPWPSPAWPQGQDLPDPRHQPPHPRAQAAEVRRRPGAPLLSQGRFVRRVARRIASRVAAF